jgi:MFS family permease
MIYNSILIQLILTTLNDNALRHILPINRGLGENKAMLPLIRSVSAPLLSLLFLMMGSGLFNTFVSIRLEMEGYSNEMIGLVTSALYLGILIGSLRIDRWVSAVGHIRAFVVLASIMTLLVIFQSFWMNPWYWAFLRLLGGVCTAGVFIIIESWLLMQSAPNMRGGILSVYLAVLYGALSSGQLLIDVSNPLSVFPFCITALLVVTSILPVSMRKTCQPKIEQSTRLSLIQMYRISPLGFIGGIISGMVLAAIYGLVPIYAHDIGMSVSQIGAFMAVLIFGGFSLQWPVGRWADKGDRRRVIKTISFVTTVLALCLAVAEQTWLLFILAWLFGGFSFTLYPVAMAHACERVKESEIVAATGGFVLSYGIGAVAGPLLAPIAMGLFGPSGVFYFIAAISTILGLIGLRRPAPAIIDK